MLCPSFLREMLFWRERQDVVLFPERDTALFKVYFLYIFCPFG